jgi:hypothetical protein
MALNNQSSCLSLWNSRVIGTCFAFKRKKIMLLVPSNKVEILQVDGGKLM